MYFSSAFVGLYASTLLIGCSGATGVPSQIVISNVPPPPQPEPVEVFSLQLPPSVTTSQPEACSRKVNPNGTGCIAQVGGLKQSGGFLPDGVHVTARVNFTGSEGSSIYSGDQIIILKTDDSKFPNGDSWKCITCGVPSHNSAGRINALDYPQAFRDGKRLLAGTNIISCGSFELASEQCTPEHVHIYPIRWETRADGSGPGGSIRELRLHPDDVHLGYSSFGVHVGKLDQFSYFSKLQFNPSPTTGVPLSARYDLVDVYILATDSPDRMPIRVEGRKLYVNHTDPVVGELRGFSGSGKEITYLGYPTESSNIDVYAADLTTGEVRRLTSHPEYCDPVDISPDDEWTVVMDTRGSERQMFMAGMRNIPPITDMLSATVTSSTRNNGVRRFFQPYLIDRYGDRGSYFGQRLNAAGDGSPGSINDREWNGRADPKWSLDGTKIAYMQAMTLPPACGGDNPLPCQNSTEPGGRTERLMIAHLSSRAPLPIRKVETASDEVPWGTPYTPGASPPIRKNIPKGTYTLDGASSGSASIKIEATADKSSVRSISVKYNNFSDDNINFLNGMENFTSENPSITLNRIVWFSDLVQTGEVEATKKTSEDGFRLEIDVMTNIFNANGTLTTTIDGKIYRQPANGT